MGDQCRTPEHKRKRNASKSIYDGVISRTEISAVETGQVSCIRKNSYYRLARYNLTCSTCLQFRCL